jgi:hypothetical protein
MQRGEGRRLGNTIGRRKDGERREKYQANRLGRQGLTPFKEDYIPPGVRCQVFRNHRNSFQ